jgi:hypothetical protein
MKEQRQNKRFSTKLPLRLEAITSRRLRVLDVETKDISATGAFIFTKEASYIPDDTRFILNSTNPDKSIIKVQGLKQLNNCTGTLVRSTSEGIAIRFNRPSEPQMEKSVHALEKWEQPEPAEKQEPKFPDKRENIRKDASVYGIFETKNGQFRDFTRNVSEGGIFIDTETPLSFHEDIFMTLFHKNLNFPVRTDGKVVRVGTGGVGVQFNQAIPSLPSI